MTTDTRPQWERELDAMAATIPRVRSYTRSGRTVLLENVDPTGILTSEDCDTLAWLAVQVLDRPLSAFTSWTVTRYSLDSTAVVAFHLD
jgi:hypothetical protein